MTKIESLVVLSIIGYILFWVGLFSGVIFLVIHFISKFW